MTRFYYVLTLILVSLWAFITPGLVTDALFSSFRITAGTIGIIALSQVALAIPAWMTFRKWRGANPAAALPKRLGICGAAAAGAAAISAIGIEQFGPYVVVIAVVAAAAVTFAAMTPTDLRALLTGKRERAEGFKILSQAAAVEIFPQFVISEGQLGGNATTGKTYRINSNGVVVDLDKWELDFNTGEFYKIRKRVNGSVIWTVKPYNKRFVHFHSGLVRTQVIVLNVFGFGLTITGVALGFCAFAAADILRPLLIGLCPFLLVTGGALLIARRDFTEENIVGPEPLTLKRQDFGPGSAETPAATKHATDLVYKPNA